MTTLYDVTGEYLAAWEALDEAADDESVQSALAALSNVQEKLALKAEKVAAVMREFEVRAEARKAESTRLAALSMRDQARADWLREYLKQQLVASGLDKIETTRFRMTLRSNPPSVNVVDAARVPSEFQRTTITTSVDKRAVLDAWKRDGWIVPGCELVTDAKRIEVK